MPSLVHTLKWKAQAAKTLARKLLGKKDTQWARIVMDRETEGLIKGLPFSDFHVLEVSGTKWKNFGFKSYQCTSYPEYDLCSEPYQESHYDLVIAEQVLEHVPNPIKAVKNLYQMLKVGGVCLVTTPFLVRIHMGEQDFSRWTKNGLVNLLRSEGFEDIHAGAWGNRECARETMYDWTPWIPWWDSLHNEEEFPVVVWVFARK